jgi:hypothetical protein
MTKHQPKKKSKLSVSSSQQQQQQLLPEQIQHQQMEERLQIYRPELRESIEQQILQRRKNNKSQ